MHGLSLRAMTRITRTALVGHPPERMLELVRDVERYPRFLTGCTGAEVHSESGGEQLATLTMRVAGVEQRFTTRNRISRDGMRLELEQGTFSDLRGQWRFRPVGGGCRVELDLTFDFGNRLLASAFARGFRRVADRMVDDFCARAEEVYG